MTLLSGIFWRIVFHHRISDILAGVSSHEGRLHHSGQTALYLSPSPQAAGIAIDTYVKKTDPPRVLVKLKISAARLIDLRDPDVCTSLNITTETAGIPWQPQREAGHRATSWQASDAVRTTDADGLIYPARSDPNRWHIVLHRWNIPDAALVTQVGAPIAWFHPR